MTIKVSGVNEGGYLCSKKPLLEDVVIKHVKQALKKNGIKFYDVIPPEEYGMCEVKADVGEFRMDFWVLKSPKTVSHTGWVEGTGRADLSKYNKSKNICDVWFEVQDMEIFLFKKEGE